MPWGREEQDAGLEAMAEQGVANSIVFSPGAAIIAIEVVVCSICTEDQLGGRDH